MSYFSTDEFPGRVPDEAKLAALRLEQMALLGADTCHRQQGPIPCTRCGGWYDLWIDPTGTGSVILRHRRPVFHGPTPVGHELYFHKIDSFAWVGSLKGDIIRFIGGIDGMAHPLDSAPKHGHRGVSVRRG